MTGESPNPVPAPCDTCGATLEGLLLGHWGRPTGSLCDACRWAVAYYERFGRQPGPRARQSAVASIRLRAAQVAR